jgi:hypothetical protein
MLMKLKSSRVITILILCLLVVVALSCADNEIVHDCLKGRTYGFLGGLWHGFIAPFDLIGKLIWDDVTMYAPNNNGFWYAFGFLLGSGGWGFFGGKSLGKK